MMRSKGVRFDFLQIARSYVTHQFLYSVAFFILVCCSTSQSIGQSLTDARFGLDAHDAGILGCAAATHDRLIAVGQRGAIWFSESAGRKWNPVPSNTAHDLHAVAFASEKAGLVVGGTIQAYSHRSVGIILCTNDGGRSWAEKKLPGLSRLVGVQHVEGDHWIAWGDWSNHYQSALIESFDGGQAWTGRSMAVAHVQSSCWNSSGNGVVVDRLGRVLSIQSNKPVRIVPLPSHTQSTILVAACNESNWWLAGENGQVYHSRDGEHWNQTQLPGCKSDQELITIRSIATEGDQAWLVGSPGNVVWHTKNAGASWAVQSTSIQLPLYCISRTSDENLFAAGMMSVMINTRNGGKGWWQIHGDSSRVGLLNIAATASTIAWDALAYTAIESRHQSSCVVLHNQRIAERTDWLPATDIRAATMGASLSLASLDVWSNFPVSTLNSGRRRSDLSSYQTAETHTTTSSLERRVIAMIRQLQPDAIVTEAASQSDPLLQACSRLVASARDKASDGQFLCFTKEAGIPESPWNCKKILSRNEDVDFKRISEVSFSSTTSLKVNARLLGEFLSAVPYAMAASPNQPIAGSLPYFQYRTVFGQKLIGSGKNEIVTDRKETQPYSRPAVLGASSNYQAMITSIQQDQRLEKVAELAGPDLVTDPHWQDAFKQLMSNTITSQRSNSLWMLASRYRERGYWNRWRFCLDAIQSENISHSNGLDELAIWERLKHAGSGELEVWYRSKKTENETGHSSSQVAVQQAAFQAASFASPFDIHGKNSFNNGSEKPLVSLQGVVSASYEAPVEQVSNAVVSSGRKSDDTIRSKASNKSSKNALFEDFYLLAGRLQHVAPELFRSPEYTFLEISRRRKSELNSVRKSDFESASMISPVSLKSMAHQTSLIAWKEVATRELNGVVSNVSRVDYRPNLDGRLDEVMWLNATKFPLHRNGSGDHQTSSFISFAHDGEFLYLSSRCATIGRLSTNAGVQEQVGVSNSGRKHDENLANTDHISIKFDIDRDYATWFEFQIDQDGNIGDWFCDLKTWDPNWYVTTSKSDNCWSMEAAIPLKELLLTDSLNDPSIRPSWNVAITRHIPSYGVESNSAIYLDQDHPISNMILSLD